MAITCEDNKLEMPCGDCLPSPPDKPLPFVFPLYNGSSIIYTDPFFTHPSNPGKVGLSNGFSLPNYTSISGSAAGSNFAHTVPITINPPPGFPGPGLVQATAVMSISTSGVVTITMTNNGAGYTTGTTLLGVGSSLGNYFNTINVHVPTASDLGTPVAALANPLPFYPNLTLSSCKIIPKVSGYLENTLVGGSPIIVNFKWYKNGIQIGQTLSKQIIAEGRKKIVHFCPPTTFSNTDILTYQITCSATELVNFTGDMIYFIQYT